MRRIYYSILMGAILVLGFRVQAGVAEDRGELRTLRLYVAFFTIPGESCARVRELETATRPYAARLQVVGIVRGLCGGAAETYQLHCGPSYPLITIDQMPVESALAEQFAAQANDRDNYVLLLDEHGDPAAAGAGQDLTQLISELLPLSTDVSRSTWGKIKELFQ